MISMCRQPAYSCSYPADPSTMSSLATVPDMGLEETKDAIAAASKAFETWGKTTAKVRICILA